MGKVMLAAVAATAMCFGAAVYAAPIGNVDYTSTGGCAVTDISATADACIGAISGNDDNGFKDDTNANKANFNLDAFDGTLGLFGYTEWSYLGKYDVDTATSDGSGNVTAAFGSPNTWSTTTDLSMFEYVAIILKTGKEGFSAYLYDGGAPSSGEWTTTAAVFGNNAGGLSHLSIYTGPTSTTPVPLPAAGWMLIAALGGLGVAARRKKA